MWTLPKPLELKSCNCSLKQKQKLFVQSDADAVETHNN